MPETSSSRSCAENSRTSPKPKIRAAELRTKLDTLAHLHELLADEKRRAEAEAHDRYQKLARNVAGLKAEIDTLTLKNSELEYHSQNLQRQNDLFEEVVSS
jgi:hypothetical protein